MTTSAPQLAPIALAPEEGEALWAFGCLQPEGLERDDRRARRGHREPRVPGRRLAAPRPSPRGRVVLRHRRRAHLLGRRTGHRSPRRVVRLRPARHSAHVHRRSEQARFLLVTEPAGFDGCFARGERARSALEIPPAPTEPPDIAGLTALAEYGIEILGPPGIPA